MDEVEKLSGWRVVELLWPLNDMFRARWEKIRHLPYIAGFESHADAAIRAFAEAPGAGTWAALPNGVWRVLLERHQQMIAVALANEAAGNPVISLPAGLSEDDQRIGLMLLFLLEMKLPWPPTDRSRDPAPPVLPPSARGH